MATCTIAGLGIGNVRLLPRLNYSFAAILFSLLWLVLPCGLMWNAGIFALPFNHLHSSSVAFREVPPTPTPQFTATPTPTDPVHIGTPENGSSPTSPAAATESENLCHAIYTVKAGDSLGIIAEHYLGNVCAYEVIRHATNNAHAADSSFAKIDDPNKIKPGDKLCIPVPVSNPAACSANSLTSVPTLDSTRDDLYSIYLPYIVN
jgi:LysM repeat protein